MICSNTQGSYECVCRVRGFYQKDSKSVCEDFDECSSGENPCGPNSTCRNTSPSFQCDCDKGYHHDPNSLDTLACVDINECTESGGEDLCPLENTVCANTKGGYLCNCVDGFIEVFGVCEDIDECLTEGICGDSPLVGCYNTMVLGWSDGDPFWFWSFRNLFIPPTPTNPPQ